MLFQFNEFILITWINKFFYLINKYSVLIILKFKFRPKKNSVLNKIFEFYSHYLYLLLYLSKKAAELSLITHILLFCIQHSQEKLYTFLGRRLRRKCSWRADAWSQTTLNLLCYFLVSQRGSNSTILWNFEVHCFLETFQYHFKKFWIACGRLHKYQFLKIYWNMSFVDFYKGFILSIKNPTSALPFYCQPA